jgi:D-alanyl-D-alanine carboxypeptidase
MRDVRSDGGQAVPLVLAITAVVVVLAVGLATVGRGAVDAAAAQTAADAAALAAVQGGEAAAAMMAEANGAELVAVEHEGTDTVVTVRVGERTASARARPEITGALDFAGPVALTRVRGIEVNTAIAPQVEALLAASEADGVVLDGGGYRSNAAQIELRKAHCGPTAYDIYEKPSAECRPPTARPGHSMHELGLAIDFTYDGAVIASRSSPGFIWLAAHASTYGLYNLPAEPWHWSVNGK